MTVNPRTIATRARRRLQTIHQVLDDLADRGPAVYENAEQWSGGGASASSGGGANRGSSVSRPTERAALSGALDEAKAVAAMYTDLVLVQVLTGQLEIVATRIHSNLRKYIAYAGDSPEPGVDSIENLNRTDGLCPTCRKNTCTGRGNDRLRRITVAAGIQKLMCDACRKAWLRRPRAEDDHLADFDLFTKGRQA